ncbi:MAG: carboxypeptidase-like regulatory domain-containing protein, partial [Eudoraea sp.]|nr:carboxypeptidase-like regulatory domain-containing protein [Eudoraea sp.]
CCILQTCLGQIIGKVTDSTNAGIPFVNIYFEGSLHGTTTNNNGLYELPVEVPGTYTIVFKYLGFQTQKREITTNGKDALELNITLKSERFILSNVEIKATDNPANAIIRKAIEKRSYYQDTLRSYTADFYSKGLIKIKNAPEKILGQDLGDFGGGLDSTRTGIIYLSETVSKISRDNKDFKERIIASRISGDDNGFSFNTASDVDFSFYDNTIEFGNQLISPIADNAFSYYRFYLTGTFYDDTKTLINQIKVIPKRPKDNVFWGTIYIAEGSWAIYGADLKVSGEQAQLLAVDTIKIKQQHNYDKGNKVWLKVLQSIDFQYSIFGIKGAGRFTAGYKNYKLHPGFQKNEFGNKILSFEEQANEKDSIFWEGLRPVPLTTEEFTDYTIKDSLQYIRKSKKYLDSVDRINNKFKLSSILLGYSFENTFKEKVISFKSPLFRTFFNTVQGWHTGTELEFIKSNDEKGSRFRFRSGFDYGLTEHIFRTQASVSYLFNNFSRPYIQLRFGQEVIQFNRSNPIKPIGNTITSLFLENNLAKFYENNFVSLYYSEEPLNGVRISSRLSWEERTPLFNRTTYVIFGNNAEPYTSNNPLDRDDFVNAAIDNHTIATLDVGARVRFKQKYLEYPNGKFNVPDNRFPTLYLGYKKGFASDNRGYHYDKFTLRIAQELTLADKGVFNYNLKAGTFLNAPDISFADYHHFNGNRTRVTRGSYLQSFFLLPYYDFSTNKEFLEGHLEHDFKGFIMGK